MKLLLIFATLILSVACTTHKQDQELKVAAGESRHSVIVSLRGDHYDLTHTLQRIAAGEKFPHRNDGVVFQNREQRLPQKFKGYYHEYVHPTPGEHGPGAMRVVIGGDGDIWFTPDHYKTFVRVEYQRP